MTMEDEKRPIENTRKAYLEAAKTGVGYVECDVHSTLDGEIVLSHDTKIAGSKTASGRDSLPIKEMKWKDLK